MKLKVKPVLTHKVYERKEATSWRPWGGLQTQEDAEKESLRIEQELKELISRALFPMEILPLSRAQTEADLASIEEELRSTDVVLIYAAGGSEKLLEALSARARWSIVFLRHRSGPLYLWYEVLHPRLLRKRTDQFRQPGIDLDDVVVDDYGEVLEKLRALYGLKSTLGERVISIGEPSGWDGGSRAVRLAELKWGLEIITVPYQELEKRIVAVKNNADSLEVSRRQAKQYLSQQGVSLETEEKFVSNAFLLYQVFKDILNEFDARAITISECMSTIMPIAETTACLTLSLLNDEGYMAFCESDFVVIPSGILLRHISGKPVFLNDPTYPHHGLVTLAHCTAPRKMNGKDLEDVRIVTHFESDYGAAPKVEFSRQQEVTVIVPDFDEKVWVGFRGKVVESPFLPICRSQVEIQIEGDWKKLLREMRGFHWMMCYGNYLNEVGYALKKMGMEWINV